MPSRLFAELGHSFLSALGPSLLHELREPFATFLADTAAPLSWRGGRLRTRLTASPLAGVRRTAAYQGRDRFDKTVSFLLQVCNDFVDLQISAPVGLRSFISCNYNLSQQVGCAMAEISVALTSADLVLGLAANFGRDRGAVVCRATTLVPRLDLCSRAL